MVPIEKHVGQPIFVIHFPGICAISNSNCTKIQLSQGKNAKLLLEWSPAFSSLALWLEEQVLQPKAACWHVYTIIWIFQCCSIDWIVAAPPKKLQCKYTNLHQTRRICFAAFSVHFVATFITATWKLSDLPSWSGKYWSTEQVFSIAAAKVRTLELRTKTQGWWN